MPEETLWETFFDPGEVLRKLRLTSKSGDVVDFGCGYGTFTLPAARITKGMVYALDIELAMVRKVRNKAKRMQLSNVVAKRRDFMAKGTGLLSDSAGYAMLFNLLHCKEPVALLREAWRVLRTGGIVAVIHWNHDPATPRGPDMRIRPRPEQCQRWVREARFRSVSRHVLDLPPYHYGFVARKE